MHKGIKVHSRSTNSKTHTLYVKNNSTADRLSSTCIDFIMFLFESSF